MLKCKPMQAGLQHYISQRQNIIASKAQNYFTLCKLLEVMLAFLMMGCTMIDYLAQRWQFSSYFVSCLLRYDNTRCMHICLQFPYILSRNKVTTNCTMHGMGRNMNDYKGYGTGWINWFITYMKYYITYQTM